MKLIGSTVVHNRTFSGANVPKPRFVRSVLVLSKLGEGKHKICMWLQTTKNSEGTRYKVFQNIQKVFTKCAREGKATISFITPPHDVIINASAVDLTAFLNGLQHCLNPRVSEKSIKFSCPVKKIPEKSKNQLKILSNADYPARGFPRELEVLEIISLEKTHLDPRILCLENLQTLNMSQNYLQKIPEEIDLLTKLHTLVLSENRLGEGLTNDWSWLHGRNLPGSLKKLDLSRNKLKHLPNQIVKLRSLVNLDVSNNEIKRLPPGVGRLNKLKVLNIASNELSYFPCSVKMLRLENLDVSQNNWGESLITLTKHSRTTLSLQELAARVVANKRIPYGPADLPTCLSNYLDSANYCVCRGACFSGRFVNFRTLNLMDIASSVVHEAGRAHMAPVQLCFCSERCQLKYRPKHCCPTLQFFFAI